MSKRNMNRQRNKKVFVKSQVPYGKKEFSNVNTATQRKAFLSRLATQQNRQKNPKNNAE